MLCCFTSLLHSGNWYAHTTFCSTTQKKMLRESARARDTGTAKKSSERKKNEYCDATGRTRNRVAGIVFSEGVHPTTQHMKRPTLSASMHRSSGIRPVYSFTISLPNCTSAQKYHITALSNPRQSCALTIVCRCQPLEYNQDCRQWGQRTYSGPAKCK